MERTAFVVDIQTFVGNELKQEGVQCGNGRLMNAGRYATGMLNGQSGMIFYNLIGISFVHTSHKGRTMVCFDIIRHIAIAQLSTE